MYVIVHCETRPYDFSDTCLLNSTIVNDIVDIISGVILK